MLSVKNLVKTYKTGDTELTVLKNLSFNVKDGEFVAITGRSGSGKSTLLYQLSLLDVPTSGTILIDEINANSVSDNARIGIRLRQFGYVFQDYALIPTLTARENVMVPLLMQGDSFKIAEKRADAALMSVGMADKFDNLPNQLSGGQQQRISIARAIGHQPKILFADEPTANLDNETSKQILDTFLDLHRKGQTIIMVTHELEYAKLTNRIMTMSDGKIIKDQHLKD